MAQQIDADLEALRNDIGKMRADLTRLSETLQDLLLQGGSDVIDKLRESTEWVKSEAKRTGQTLTQEIEERPIAAVIIAFIAGMVLGALFNRRS
jgi:ElaB/YqjD/DUF883 family membrane-anchored ribosome-binding protein